MLKRLNFLLISFLILISTAYSESLTLERRGEFFPDHSIRQISAKNNYLFVLGVAPDVNSLFQKEVPYDLKEVPYSFFDIIDLRNSQAVFSSGYLYKELNKGGTVLIKDKYMTISDKYAFVGFLGSFGPNGQISETPSKYTILTKVYDISNLPEVAEVGSINVFPNAVSGNKAFMITNKGISVYDITDVSNPMLKGKYSKPGIFKIVVAGDRAYIGYYDDRKKGTFLEILDIRNFSFKKIERRYPLLKGKRAMIFNRLIKPNFLSIYPYYAFHLYAFYVRDNYVYILNGKKVRVIDARDLDNIKEISSVEGISGSFYNGLSNNYAILLGQPTVLLDISDPYNISVVGTIEDIGVSAPTTDMTSSGGYVIIKETPPMETAGPQHPVKPEGDRLILFEIVPLMTD